MSTLYEELLAAELPVISVDESRLEVSMGAMTPEERILYDAVLRRHFTNVDDGTIANIYERNILKRKYSEYITDLDAIADLSSPTAAEVVQAVKRLAVIQKNILKVLKLIAQGEQNG